GREQRPLDGIRRGIVQNHLLYVIYERIKKIRQCREGGRHRQIHLAGKNLAGASHQTGVGEIGDNAVKEENGRLKSVEVLKEIGQRIAVVFAEPVEVRQRASVI